MARPVALLAASAALSAGFFLILHLYFSDVVPVALAEVPQVLWRFETAFVVLSLAWIFAFVAVMATLLIGREALRRLRSTTGPNRSTG
jgi:hypothetical protein